MEHIVLNVKIGFVDIMIKSLFHYIKTELDDVCIYCLVRDKNVYQITYTTDLSDEDDSDSNVSTQKVSETNLRTNKLWFIIRFPTKILSKVIANVRIYQQLFDLLPHDYNSKI